MFVQRDLLQLLQTAIGSPKYSSWLVVSTPSNPGLAPRTKASASHFAYQCSSSSPYLTGWWGAYDSTTFWVDFVMHQVTVETCVNSNHEEFEWFRLIFYRHAEHHVFASNRQARRTLVFAKQGSNIMHQQGISSTRGGLSTRGLNLISKSWGPLKPLTKLGILYMAANSWP